MTNELVLTLTHMKWDCLDLNPVGPLIKDTKSPLSHLCKVKWIGPMIYNQNDNSNYTMIIITITIVLINKIYLHQLYL